MLALDLEMGDTAMTRTKPDLVEPKYTALDNLTGDENQPLLLQTVPKSLKAWCRRG